MALTSSFYYLDLFLVQETFLKCACLGASKYLSLHSELRFPAICSMQNYKIFNYTDPSGDSKTSKFLPYNFSRYKFEKFQPCTSQ